MRVRSVQLELLADKKKSGRYEECRKTSEGHKKKNILDLFPKFIIVV